MSGDVRLLKLTAKKTPDGNYTVACTANGKQIEVHVKNTPGDIGQGVIDLETGVHGIAVR
jgi:YD repeat-containing protein